MSNKIQVRRGVLADLLITILDAGELGWTTDTQGFYLGDGSTAGGIKIGGSPTTTDFTVYVATSALGGTAGGTGLLLQSSTTTGTGSSKLIDSGGGFADSKHLNKPVYNSTDDTWAKITAVDSSTQCSISANIFVSGEAYEINDAVDTIPLGINKVENPFFANPTILVSPGTFSDDFEMVGLNPAGSFTLTLQGSTTSTTTVSGEVTTRQRFNTGNITFTKRIFEESGTDIDWTTCVTSGDDGFILRNSDNVANTFRSTSVVIFENDPGIFTNISSTVTTGYSFYVASASLGGSDSNDGLLITQGTTTGAGVNLLVDSTANFNDADHLGKTVHNTTDDTWAEITTVNSTTQLVLDADIMASGESYKIVSAYATYQALHDDTIPGTINADTDVKFSNETHSSAHVTQGKGFSGAYTLKLLGSKAADVALTALTSATQGDTNNHGTLTLTGAGWTVDEHKGKWVFDTTNSEYNLIQSNTATVLTIVGIFTATPAANFAVYSSTTTFSGAQTVQEGQLSTQYEFVTWNVAGETWIDIKANSFLRFLRCDILGYRATGGSEVEASYTYIHGEKSRLAWAQILSRHNVPRCLVESTGAGATVCIQTDSDAYVGNRDTTFVVDGTSTNTTGIYVSLNSSAIFFVAGTKNDLKNNVTYGLRCETGGQAAFTSTTYFVFSGNGTDRSADAASFAFFS